MKRRIYRIKCSTNSLIGHLNINLLRNKISDLWIVLKTINPDYFIVRESKLEGSFTSGQFIVYDYQIRNRRDRSKFGGGLTEYVKSKSGFICNRFKELETKSSETICSELKIANQIQLFISVYRSPSPRIDTFFKEFESSLNDICIKYDKYIIMGDFNIVVKKLQCLGNDKLL